MRGHHDGRWRSACMWKCGGGGGKRGAGGGGLRPCAAAELQLGQEMPSVLGNRVDVGGERGGIRVVWISVDSCLVGRVDDMLENLVEAFDGVLKWNQGCRVRGTGLAKTFQRIA